MTEKEIGPREDAGREAELNEGENSFPDLPRETKRKFNGHGKPGSWNEEEPGSRAACQTRVSVASHGERPRRG